jgi:hypothetical protein
MTENRPVLTINDESLWSQIELNFVKFLPIPLVSFGAAKSHTIKNLDFGKLSYNIKISNISKVAN